jgi:ABC-type bacteriocin/lantibiotic exporter with double-glycine peptidase domain
MRLWSKLPLASLFLAGLLMAAEGGVWLDVPFVKQEKDGCGAASIAMIMQYWHRQKHEVVSADLPQIEKSLYSEKAHGAYASGLKRYLDDHGYATFIFRADWSDLEQHLKKGRPLIVALKPRGQSELHYAVVAGLDPVQNIVLTNDPAQRKLLKQSRSDFEKEWKATDNWTLLAVPEEQNQISSSH